MPSIKLVTYDNRIEPLNAFQWNLTLYSSRISTFSIIVPIAPPVSWTDVGTMFGLPSFHENATSLAVISPLPSWNCTPFLILKSVYEIPSADCVHDSASMGAIPMLPDSSRTAWSRNSTAPVLAVTEQAGQYRGLEFMK